MSLINCPQQNEDLLAKDLVMASNTIITRCFHKANVILAQSFERIHDESRTGATEVSSFCNTCGRD